MDYSSKSRKRPRVQNETNSILEFSKSGNQNSKIKIENSKEFVENSKSESQNSKFQNSQSINTVDSGK